MARTYPKHEAKKRALQIPYDLSGRREFLLSELKKYEGKTFHCKTIGANVIITADSIDETAQKAAISRKATKLCLFLPYIIRNCNIVKLHLPTESKKQTSKFHFTDIGIFRCNVPKVGIAKIVIGCRNNGKAIEYAITDYQA